MLFFQSAGLIERFPIGYLLLTVGGRGEGGFYRLFLLELEGGGGYIESLYWPNEYKKR